MHTDPLFYRIFQERPETVFELAGLPLPAGARYALTAAEVKQAAFRFDGVLTPQHDDDALPLVFVETQFQRVGNVYARWLAAIFLYLYQHCIERPWRAVVVYPERATEAPAAPSHASIIDCGLIHRVYLGDLAAVQPSSVGVRLARLVVLDNATAVVEARGLAALPQAREQQLAIIDLIETILVYKLPTLSRQEIRAMLQLPDNIDLKDTRFYQEVFAEGHSEGIEEGREEGREEGERRLLLHQLERRFGPLPTGHQAAVRALDAAGRFELADALFELDDRAALAGWLSARGCGTDAD